MAKLTVITSIYPEKMSKEYRLESDGQLSKTTSANLASGTYEQKDIASLNEMAFMLKTLTANQVLVFGLTQHASGILTTKDRIKKTSDQSVIARSNSYIKFSPNESWMFLDYDPHGDFAYSMTELKALLENAVPDLFKAGAVMYPSASSNITNTATGQDLTGNRGIHIYIPVICGLDIPRASTAIQDRLWLTGHGHIEISKSGSLLERTLLDPSVAQDAKLDFAAGAICHAPLKQCRMDPWIIPATGKCDLLDTAKVIKNVRDQKSVSVIKDDAKKALIEEAAKVKERHARERAFSEACTEDGTKTPSPATVDNCYRRIISAIDGKPLDPSFILHLQLGNEIVPVTVEQILADPDRYDGVLCLDPIEPSYEGNKIVGKIYTAGKYVSSFAHGGRRFYFGNGSQFALHISRNDHMGTAKALIDLITEDREFGFLSFGGYFYRNNGKCYEVITGNTQKTLLMTYLSKATCTNNDGDIVPVNPDNALLKNLETAMMARSLVEVDPDNPPPPPFMLDTTDICQGQGQVFVPRKDRRGHIESGRYLTLRNGLYDLKEDVLVPHNRAFFSTSCANFDFDENAECPLMMATINDWFDGDKDTIDLYFRMLGYLMSSETSAHKIFGLFGPTRSGKGVTASLIEALVGGSGIWTPSLDELAAPKGLEPIINKKVVIFTDVKDAKMTSGGIGERLLKISAADMDSIPRLYKEAYRGRHTARIVMCGNSPPNMPEASRALERRFVVMSFKKCYLDNEDRSLTDKLLEELPGIFNRALKGFREWQQGAKFESPHASREHVRHLRDAINVIPSFIEECCEVGDGYYVDTDVLYEAYRNFAGDSGRHSITKQRLCKDLYAYDMRFTNRRVRRANVSGHLISGLKLTGHTETIELESGELFQVKSLPGSTVITGKTIHGEAK